MPRGCRAWRPARRRPPPQGPSPSRCCTCRTRRRRCRMYRWCRAAPRSVPPWRAWYGRRPVISSTVSPRTRSAIRKPPICDGVALPDMMMSNASSASSSLRRRPAATPARIAFISDISAVMPRAPMGCWWLGRLTGPVRRTKFASSSWPCSEAMLSGWNCTPWIGSSRCINPMIRPSSLSAVTFSTSGRVSRSTISEW